MPELVTAPWLLIVVGVLAYLLGSVPFGIVMARAFGLGDLRRIGSGNIGATNVLRTGNRTAALLTLVLDAGKGAIAVLAARALVGTADAVQTAAFFAFLGHCAPLYLWFRGGKGVATFLGTTLALAWPVGLAACLTWLAGAALTRISSAAALIASALVPAWALLLGRPEAIVLLALLASLVWWRHRPNITRILKGEEPRIGSGRMPPPDPPAPG